MFYDTDSPAQRTRHTDYTHVIDKEKMEWWMLGVGRVIFIHQ
jgi:hypothetical protein